MNYICNICGKEFETKQKLGGHKIIHLPKNKYVCPYCGKEFFTSQSAFNHHVTQTHINIDKDTNSSLSEFNSLRDDLFCQYCGEQCKNKNSLVNHERLCSLNPEYLDNSRFLRLRENPMKGKPAWNRGLTKESDSRVASISTSIKNRIQEQGSIGYCGRKGSNNSMASLETRKKLSKSMKEVYSKKEPKTHQYKTKSGYYKNIWCDSSWELAYLVYCLDHNFDISRTNDRFSYTYKDKVHSYFPDFYREDLGTYIEIKGYITDKDKSKFLQFPKNLEIIDSSKITEYYDYAVTKYGSNFWEILYNDH